MLAVDVSASVTADSYVLQRDGIARAFENAALVERDIGRARRDRSAGPRMVGPRQDRGHRRVDSGWPTAKSAAGFAAARPRDRRSSNGLTAIGPALLAAAAAFERLPEPAERRIIDISGDGMANFGLPPAVARDRIVAAGISINGLAILTEEPWLEGYYRSNVIGGSGAFVMWRRISAASPTR